MTLIKLLIIIYRLQVNKIITTFLVPPGFLFVPKVALQKLSHSKSSNLVSPKDWFHGLVWGEELLVLRVLQLLSLYVDPESLNHLRPGHLLVISTEQFLQLFR